MIAFNGARSSWLVLARNIDLTRLARSASWRSLTRATMVSTFIASSTTNVPTSWSGLARLGVWNGP